MIINSVLLDKKRYKLVDTEYCNKNNAFTIIVGSNGTGKSRLLKRIVNNVKNVNIEDSRIPKNYSRQLDFDLDGYKASFYSPVSESKSFVSTNKKEVNSIDSEIKVIAVTTTPFDKFPIEYKGNETYRYHDDHRYTYIGLKVSKNSLNQSNYLNLLSRSMLSSDRIFKNKKLFSLLNLNAKTSMQMKAKLPTKNSDFMEYNYKTRKIELQNLDEGYFVNFIIRNHFTIYEKLDKVNGLISKAYNAYVNCYPFLSSPINPENRNVPKNDLILLLDIGLINASDIMFTDSKNKVIKISELSSGQKCMILTLLNISGSISDNSIVCIDEPEISLHPRWQKEFMKILIEFFSDFKKCHFIIATHSPLIISELSNENCFILNMDIGLAKKANEYKNMSSDYQLAEVFGISGNNNEYLNRIVVSLLSKLSKSGNLDKTDKLKLDALVRFSKGMDEGDSVKELIDILSLAWSKVSKNAK
ncbi:AAA family ATPase [Photobacterium chitinilyticum]|uniref:Endonuclease GajA/Old nuclease/RecF-like AAA domain-containing protein n=1 Tax=Photobacterium chitinilyticum TaxID=2485123 RepID=A0A3S3RBQ0_9GAMM|nr:AAA family ATPase [Photobacterium chitinilyticum]RWX57203.1 hypothetical protein EDI28_04005 [Photobacterium chitinilyticum]